MPGHSVTTPCQPHSALDTPGRASLNIPQPWHRESFVSWQRCTKFFYVLCTDNYGH